MPLRVARPASGMATIPTRTRFGRGLPKLSAPDRSGPFRASLALVRAASQSRWCAARQFAARTRNTTMALDRQTLDQAALDALVGKAVSELAAGYGGVMIDIGHKLGLYKAMAGARPGDQPGGGARRGLRRALRPRMAERPGGGRLRRSTIADEPDLRADARAGLRARRREEPGLHAADLGGGRRRLGRRGEDHRGHPHRPGRELGRARRPALLRRRGLLPQRLPREPRRRMAAGARRRGREARGRRAGRRHRLRPRPFDAADGRGLPERRASSASTRTRARSRRRRRMPARRASPTG